MSFYNFKSIVTVPTAKDFIDIILSKTQRKTPTVIHPNYKISRIRDFYMRKVKFAQEAFNEKFQLFLQEFPKLDDIHPFYADLMNVLYDKDHYKLALGQLNTARHLIEQLAKDYVKLLKFGDSLYRCKQLKRAALGRMATICKGLKDSLIYLEQVRQHLSRLPSIDPNTRTLLICGYPNVGKSSFMNKLTRANVDVQPYAFTTKSLFVGHMDYDYVRWQLIDTPGILDHPLEDRNTIEMQSITALAHLKAAILYFMDLSEQCGYSIKAQVSLFHSIRPLFSGKPVVLVINKIDVRRYEDLTPEEKECVDTCLTDGVVLHQQSCYTDAGVVEVRNAACKLLLQARVDVKLRNQRINDVLGRLNVTLPQPRDSKSRPPFIPEQALRQKEISTDMLPPRKLERDLEREQGGAGVYNVDLKKNYFLNNDLWKYDAIPEIMDGKNVADYIDPEIEAQLTLLELEEERYQLEGAYDSDVEMDGEEMHELRSAARLLNAKKSMIIHAHRLRNGKTKSVVSRPIRLRRQPLSKLTSDLQQVDKSVSLEPIAERLAKLRQKRTLFSSAMDVDPEPSSSSSSSSSSSKKSLAKAKRPKIMSEFLARRAQKIFAIKSRAGESDRAIYCKRPKHLFTGKRGIGKNDRR
ncbi:Nucleolar GTP-binding protein 1 [Coelomomyces lativittatus]|nr:Nucleolar GTP-binding protein 1 [Coelomomyces lativittatus]KAJ1515977.1 Nucleolar GTP-binding protein 1 [Coelomomyces lativittatus]KAJ1517358.1 Nucleolar GTP-binding protein 1 [Coelomomyces lativittatus]